MTEQIIDAVLDESIELATVDIIPSTWWGRLLISLKIKKQETRSIYLKAATAATLFKISKLVLALRTKSEKSSMQGEIFDLIHANTGHLVNFVAIAVHNSKGNPPAWLLDALENQFSLSDLQEMSNAVYRRLGIEPFFGIMGLLQSPDLKMVQDLPSQAAPGDTSVAS